MELHADQIRAFRLRAHHLDRFYPMDDLCAAAGACGLQNSPPGSWETALLNRLEGCTREALDRALCAEKTLLQAWSYRGVPVVFPTAESPVFLTALRAKADEQPAIYTRGITLGLEQAGLSLETAAKAVRQGLRCLEQTTVRTKETLDQTIADASEFFLPPAQLDGWRAPSPYSRPDRQTIGGAIVSFLLRPGACEGQVVFGAREGIHPTFTSYAHWIGSPPPTEGDCRTLVRKFVHCYGPTMASALQNWLGCTPAQARRLWKTAESDLTAVQVDGKKRWVLTEDLEDLCRAEPPEERLLLLGPHDPYLDLRDRALILPDPARARMIWKTVGNPGVILRGGTIIGLWTTRTTASRLTLTLTVWEPLSDDARRTLETRAQAYAAFRGLTLSDLSIG